MTRHYGSSDRTALITAQNAITHEFNPILRKRRKLNGKVLRTHVPTVALAHGKQPQNPNDAAYERSSDYRRALKPCADKLCDCACRQCHAGDARCKHDCRHATCIATFHRIAQSNGFAQHSFMHGICFERLPKTTDGVLQNYAQHNAETLAKA